ncbi:MAG: FliA/WhiG family RNA polymerase sigma factor [Deltaproteobacteria bacterium]|nr:FliA/WhiG family RNA polymerase sigma factor [Deltaproteobacteria bacterium]
MMAQINKYQQALQTDQGFMDKKSREDLILKYAPLVKYIADRMAIRLPPNVSSEELTSAGIVGLYDALEKFDSEKGFKFQTYAEHRIKGAMLDELRKMGWASRFVMKDVHRIEDALNTLKCRLGREPEDFEVAREMGVDIDAYYRMTSRAQGVSLLSLDEIMPDGTTPKYTERTSATPSPLDELKSKELKGIISNALLGLTKKEQLVVSLYYYDELTLKEIGRVLDLTESRVSQIHSKAIIKLRAKLRSHYEAW